jgi:oxygen-independent coproporphyrinogen III oxidase
MMSGDHPEDVSLYIHIPFCTRKCDYCHFYVIPDKPSHQSQLLEGIEREWRQRAPLFSGRRLRSIYFGGGTPSLMGPEAIEKMLGWFLGDSDHIDDSLEITLEANPERLTLAMMRDYAAIGINRVSIGLQTTDDPLLKSLGRLHTAAEGLQAVHNTFEAGIRNISVDLMTDLPMQTLQHWHRTLADVIALPITHLSLYNLTIEPQTAFYQRRKQLQHTLPDETTSTLMLKEAIETLSKHGLEQYEISAFARDNHRSRHNVGYWTGRPFIGLGPSAFSYWEGKRFRNVASLHRYCEQLTDEQLPVDFEEELSPEAKQRELLVIALRLVQGVNLDAFQQQQGLLAHETEQQLETLQARGWLRREGPLLLLTAEGRLFYDSVAVELI